jgi:membrane-associated phospholipid phosphatase
LADLYRKTMLAAGVTGVTYLILFIFFDRSICLWVESHFPNTYLFHIANHINNLFKGSYFSLGLALGLILVIVIDPGLSNKLTKNLLYVFVSVSLAMVLGDGLKYLLGRYRPVMLLQDNLYGFHFFATKWALNSTPSGHTLRAFSLFSALSLLYRRFTAVFITLALLVAASRVVVNDHYPSDVLFSAFLGVFCARWTYQYFFGPNPDA